MVTLQRIFNTLIILTICGILLGGFWVQFVEHETPCPLCLLQRLGMISVCAGLSLNLLYGIKMSHYALSLLSSVFGASVALRQISLHVCPGFPVFGEPVFGLSLYTWSFIIFACCISAISLLMLLYSPKEELEYREAPCLMSKFAIGCIVLITAANMVATFLQCGIGPCQDV